MNVGLDQPGHDEMTIDRLDGPRVAETRRDGGDQAVADADVDQPVRLAGNARSGKDEVEGHVESHGGTSLGRLQTAEVRGLKPRVLAEDGSRVGAHYTARLQHIAAV